jgi:bifunctional non-homologous end joining protein LigD
MPKIKWLRPKLVAHIEFTEWTKGNHLRHARFVALRGDKKASDVVKEKVS